MVTSNSNRLQAWRTLGVAGLVLASGVAFSSCDGSSGSGAPTPDSGPTDARATLMSVDYGRLVDIYAFRRIDPADPDRRDARNRVPVLIQENALISAAVEDQELFDAIGGERLSANFRFLPFDSDVGHEELVILWDDQDPIEGARFESALAEATVGLDVVPGSFRTQDTSVRPIPVIPRNAAIRLNFDRPLAVNEEFFAVNPRAIQLLQFLDDPNTSSPQQAFLPVPFRVLPSANSLILDTTLIGAEIGAGRSSTGLAASTDSETANFRIAIPVQGVGNLLSVDEDAIPELNDVDSAGNTSVVRDFRSGNAQDGRVGSLTDTRSPNLIGNFEMGILSVDPETNTVTINKRGNLVAIRGRIPFVDGAIQANTNAPGGRSTVPTINANQNREPLVAGDQIVQTITTSTGEFVTLRAQVIENLDVGSDLVSAAFLAPGLTADGTDGGELPIARLRLDRVSTLDSQGNTVMMVGNTDNPFGVDCSARVRYYEFVPYATGIAAVSDADRRLQFVDFFPNGADSGVGMSDSPEAMRGADPRTAVAFRFSEPMDLSTVNTLDNLVYSKEDVNASNFLDALDSPKAATLSFLPSRLVDVENDGSVLRLLTPLGHFHEEGQTELYWAHMVLDQLTDVSGNAVDIFDRRTPGQASVEFRASQTDMSGNVTGTGVVTGSLETPLRSFSVQFELGADAPDNLIGTRVFRFASGDEDGSAVGSVDLFGQFRLQDGQLTAAETSRFSQNADRQTLAGLTRWTRGECPQAPGRFSGLLYDTPDASPSAGANTFTFVNPPTVFQGQGMNQPFGGIAAPHVRRGSRMQMAYREDDLGLDYENADQFNIDIEQMHWAPWNDQDAFFDTFDNYTMLLGHSEKRPDRLFYFTPGNPNLPIMPFAECEIDCHSLYSGLSRTFADNPLDGSDMVAVVNQAEYVVQPALSFRSPASSVRYVPYPTFERTYTWRDSRLVSWDPSTDSVIGLGGAIDPFTPPVGLPLEPAGGDRTASVSSPWSPNDVGNSADPIPNAPLGPDYVRDVADFLGDRQQDHDPIALPLLVEWQVRPDTTVSSALSFNQFWSAYVGPPFIDTPFPGATTGGYFNNSNGPFHQGDGNTRTICGNPTAGTGLPFPLFRVHSTGGTNPTTMMDELVNPPDTPFANGGQILDIGLGQDPLGLFAAPAGDGNVYWTQVDFVRKTSMMTFGFFDTFQPNQFDASLTAMGAPLPPSVEGRPNFFDQPVPADLFVDDFVLALDPPFTSGGTSVVVEFRGVEQIGAEGTPDPTLYDPGMDDNPLTRGNLLNANYACEAYRYAALASDAAGTTSARIPATGFTPYVPFEDIDSIRDVRGALPRYLNLRMIMENNISSSPNVSPSVNHAYIAYRMSLLSDN